MIRSAIAEDWPAIEIMRDAYFAKHNRPSIVRTLTDRTWIVSEADGIVQACLSYYHPQANIAWCSDLFRHPGRRGTLAVGLLTNWFLDECDRCGLEACFYVDVDNAPMLAWARNGGKFEELSVLFHRKPQTH